MKACVIHQQLDLRYETVADPVLSRPDDVLVRMLSGGICGSDMHYYLDGGIGTLIRVQAPMIMGHEGMGVVEAVGEAVTTVSAGDEVVIRPARPCFACFYCQRGQFSYCENMQHLGSAARVPHCNGLFAEKVLLHASQVAVVRGVAPEVGAFAEPLAVAYNGVRHLGELFGKEVLVMGAGPIGCLCVAVAKLLGAGRVCVVDVRDEPLALARRMGADAVCNSRTDAEQITRWKAHRGVFDSLIEASGNPHALADGMAMTRPEGIVAQVGMFAAGHEPRELGPFMTKGLQWRSVFRFYDEFGAAARALEQGHIDPLPLLTGHFAAADCVQAMQAARSPEHCKVQLLF